MAEWLVRVLTDDEVITLMLAILCQCVRWLIRYWFSDGRGDSWKQSRDQDPHDVPF